MVDAPTAGMAGSTGHPSGHSVLRRCIGVEVETFAQSHWGSAALLSPGVDGARAFADLFSPAAVDELVSTHGLRTPFLRMAKNGSVLASTTFTRSGGIGATIADQVADDKVLARLADGATLVLQALHRTWPPLVRFGSSLAAELGHPVQINAYITPPDSQGFASHYDTHDVFVLQVAGSKRWTIHAPVIDDPLPSQTWEQRTPAVAARAAEPALIDTLLTPGDALYLPRGFLHSAVAQGEVSIHLTVGMHPLTGYDLAAALLTGAAGDRDLRRSLPLGIDVSDRTMLSDHLRAAAKRLAAVVADPEPEVLESVARTVAGQRSDLVRPAPLAPLAQLTALAGLHADTALVLRPGLTPGLHQVGDQVLLRTVDSTVNWPAAVAEALRYAMSGDGFRPAELPGLDEQEQLVVARRLLREGVVVPADPTPDDG